MTKREKFHKCHAERRRELPAAVMTRRVHRLFSPCNQTDYERTGETRSRFCFSFIRSNDHRREARVWKASTRRVSIRSLIVNFAPPVYWYWISNRKTNSKPFPIFDERNLFFPAFFRAFFPFIFNRFFFFFFRRMYIFFYWLSYSLVSCFIKKYSV